MVKTKKSIEWRLMAALIAVVIMTIWSWTPQFPLFKDPLAKKGGEYFQSNELVRNLHNFKANLLGWDKLERQKKFDILEYVINYIKKEQHVRITKSPTFYLDLIDAELAANPDMQNLPIERVVTILAVMEYDFDNGRDKPEDIALKVLGPKVFAINAQRKKDYKPRLE